MGLFTGQNLKFLFRLEQIFFPPPLPLLGGLEESFVDHAPAGNILSKDPHTCTCIYNFYR